MVLPLKAVALLDYCPGFVGNLTSLPSFKLTLYFSTSITFVESHLIFMSEYQLFCFTVSIVCHIRYRWDLLFQHFDEVPLKF